ncbi:MAG: hypothetical protein LC107_00200 [Chitinophagales bacterium]|nr:hypothetical protein [Chitinophagales bacterium]
MKILNKYYGSRLLVSMLMVMTLFFGCQMLGGKKTPPTEAQMQVIFKKDIEKMGRCLIERDYNCFIEFNHPLVIEIYGSKEEMKNKLNVAMRDFRDAGGEYKRISFIGIQQIESNGDDIQVLLNQEAVMDLNGQEILEPQMILAVSEDSGSSWRYIQLVGMNKASIQAIFPALNQRLIF